MTDTGGVLARNVTVRGPQGLASFLAGDTPPVWALPLLKSPILWHVEPEDTPDPNVPDPNHTEPVLEAPEPPAPAVEAPAPAPATETAEEPEEDLLGTLPRPPKNGAGSGGPAWAAYAKQEGVVVADDSTRTEIIAAVEAAGK